MTAVAVIPARYASTRLARKLLLADTGKPVLQHTWEQVVRARNFDRVLVATDDARIRDAARGFGAEVVMTAADHKTGSDRVAEVARTLAADVVVNVQGDEPQIAPEDLDRLVVALRDAAWAAVATLAVPIRAPEVFLDPGIVKVVCGAGGRALYFSRAPIPCPAAPGTVPPGALKHKGVYAWRRAALLEIAGLPQVDDERTERLEQLRALYHGYPFLVLVTERDGIEINTPSDYERFCKGGPSATEGLGKGVAS